MARLFDVRPEERRAAALAFAALLGITAAHTLVETARDALFLARVPVEHLPALYLAIAVAGLGTTRLGAILEKRRGTSTSSVDPVAASLGGAALVTFGFWFAAASPTRAVLYALYIYSGMFAAWVAGRLWIRLGAVFTVAQAKRLYGLIGTGGVLGAVLGATVARASLVVLEVRHLLVIGAALLVVTAIGPAALLPKPAPAALVRSRRDDDDDDDDPRKNDDGLGARAREVFGHPYLVRLLALTTIAAVVGTTIDFLFKREVAASIAKADLAPFLATVSLATNVSSLVAQAVGVTLAMRWLGVHRALYVMPLLLGAGAASAVLGLGLVAALALRGIDGTLRHSLHKTTTELLFVPLPDLVRARAKPIVDLVGQRGGQAVASIALLGLAALAGKHLGVLAGGIVAVFALGWLFLAHDIRPRYLDVFRGTLRRGRAELSSELPVLDIDALEVLISALSSRRDAEVLGALDLLAAQERGRLIPSLVLYHPSKLVVLQALELLVREGRTNFVPVADRLLSHADPEIRAAALRARAAVEPDVDLLRELLESESREGEVRATALAALVASGALRRGDAREKLTGFTAASAPVHVRRALAQAIGEVHGAPDADARALLEETLSTLVRDDDVETRERAAASFARFPSPAVIATLIELLSDRRAGIAAIESLATIGDAALVSLDEVLDRKDLAPETRWRAVRALGRSTAKGASQVLARRLASTSDTAVRTRILHALRARQAAGETVPVERTELTNVVEQTIAQIGRALSLRLAHAKLRPERATPGGELIASLLRDKEIEGRERLFLVLGLLHPGERFARIQRGLDSPNAKTRASSRELLENILRAPLRERVLAVVDDASDEERAARIGEKRTEETYEALLGTMQESGGELGAIAAYHAREIGLRKSDRAKDADIFAREVAAS
jgi:ATP:ADP antiporter, AAA family